MNLKQFKYVLTLADEGTFSGAADLLNISQPSLSQYIKNIEKQLGVTLFDRTGSEVRLTDAGQVYIDAGRRILDLEHQMQSRFSELSQYRSGSIIVGISPYRSVCLMPEVVSQFRRLYPGICITLEERVGRALLDDAERGQFDLCITTLPVNERIFAYEPVMREEIAVAVPAGSELCDLLSASASKGGKHPTIDIKLLDGQDFVMLTENQLMQHIFDDACDEYGISPRTAAICQSVEAQIAMVKVGIGSALVPLSIASFGGDDGRIKYFGIAQPLPCRDVVAIYRKGQHLSRAVTDLIEIMKHVGNI